MRLEYCAYGYPSLSSVPNKYENLLTQFAQELMSDLSESHSGIIAPPFSPVVAAAVVCPPNSQPELTKVLNAVSLSKTKKSH